MAKDVNIHIKTPGAQQAKQQLDQVGQAARNTGDKVVSSTKKLGGVGKILGTLKTQVMGFVGAWVGMQGVQKIIGYLIQKLERVKQLQQDIYDKSIQLSEIGQALEFQTGTKGQQQFWTQQALGLQKAGGLTSPAVAQQMMISADIAFAGQGGIKSQQTMQLLKDIAPFFGAAGLSSEEAAQVFEFGGTAGVTPTAQGYKQFMAQLQSGYTASKSTSFGQFMTGLQKGGTAYMTQGGTLTEAISAFSSARSVMPNENLAATLLEQVARLSSGAYEKPRAAIEKGLGVRWGQLSMDQRTQAMLKYVGGIPEAQRGQVLTEMGFPIEMSTQISKMVSPEAQRTMQLTRDQVQAAQPGIIDQLSFLYMQSTLGRQRILDADIAARQQEAGPDFASWQRRVKKARSQHQILMTGGKDRPILDKHEPYVMALDDMYAELQAIQGQMPTEELNQQARMLMIRTGMVRDQLTDYPGLFLPESYGATRGQRLSEEYKGLMNSSHPVIINDHSTNYNPRTGSDGRGPRADRDIR